MTRFPLTAATLVLLLGFAPNGFCETVEARKSAVEARTVETSADSKSEAKLQGKWKPRDEIGVYLQKFLFLKPLAPLKVNQLLPDLGDQVDASGAAAVAVMFDHAVTEQSIQNVVALHRLSPYPQNNLPGKVMQSFPEVLIFAPNSQFNEGAVYQVILKGGPNGPRTQKNQTLTGDVVWTFSTKGMPASPCQGACFGTLCQQSYQNNWQEGRNYVWGQCNMFNAELDETDTNSFYYSLEGATDGFTSCDGCNGKGIDTVHLLYINTHGQAVPNEVNVNEAPNACLAKWAQGKHILSKNDKWRFGDEGVRNAFFAQYACETLKIDDKTVDRWLDVFRGGMIMAMGSHGTIYDGETTDECGEDFADGLQKGKSVKWAWFDGLSDWYADQDVAVLVSGSQLAQNGDALADCTWRKNNVKWQNFGGFIRWRDEQVNYLCMSWIDDH